MSRRRKLKEMIKEQLQPHEEIFTIDKNTRLIVKSPKGVTAEQINELALHLSQLREGIVHTIVVPYEYKFYTLKMEESDMDKKDKPKKQLVGTDSENADEKLENVKDKIVNDS